MHLRHFAFSLIVFVVLACQSILAQQSGWTVAKLISAPTPPYPKEAKSSGLAGKVLVVVDIDDKGSVTSANGAFGPDSVCPQVERPDVVALRNAAKAAALKAKFVPAMKDGKRISSTVVVDFQFGRPPLEGTKIYSSGRPVRAFPIDRMDTLGSSTGLEKPSGRPKGVDPDGSSVGIGAQQSAQSIDKKVLLGDAGAARLESAQVDQRLGPSMNASPELKIVSGGVLNGKAIKLPSPPYPPAARAVRASGAVSIQVLIDENGYIFSAEPVSGHPLLQSASRISACGSRFQPTLLNGQPVKVAGVIVYNFVP